MSPLVHGDRELELTRGRSLFDYADDLSVRVPTSCRRDGECHECIVEVRQGLDALSPPTEAETFLRGNYRLACQAFVENPDAPVEFAILRRQPKILQHGIQRDFEPSPLTVRRGDDVVSLHGGHESAGGRVIDKYRGAIWGIAVDVGTTTVVMNLVDLESFETMHTASFENPQRFGGSDIMNRISYDGGEFGGELKQVIHSSINFEIGEMVRLLKIRRRQIYEMVVVGNSTMRDIFFGLDVQSMGEKPYRSVTEQEFLAGDRATTSLTVKAGELGIRIHPDAVIYGGPLIGSHVGADVAADLLAVAMDEAEEPVILIDVGTNTEIVMGTKDRLLSASCPAGPAFEGGQVTYSMPGYDGAIEAIELDDEGVKSITVIGDVQPQGICGSGLIDLISELRRTGRINELGVFENGSTEFVFEPNARLTLSRADLSTLAQAKSANYCGQSIVLARYGLPLSEYKKFYLAGGFANYINVRNAANIGFVADVEDERIAKVGNASLSGATIMLLSGPLRQRMEELVREIEHVELETEPDFFDLFVEGCQFKPMSG
ncbi:MAG: DUF4445 domain-containing protein [Chloroflexi bacterium]|nr:DUF4445 domain-containing protein [Chloroflexota bacterium]